MGHETEVLGAEVACLRPTVTRGHIQNSGALAGPLLVFSLMRVAVNVRHRSITINVTVITREETRPVRGVLLQSLSLRSCILCNSLVDAVK